MKYIHGSPQRIKAAIESEVDVKWSPAISFVFIPEPDKKDTDHD